jgi:hypothetical protein
MEYNNDKVLLKIYDLEISYFEMSKVVFGSLLIRTLLGSILYYFSKFISAIVIPQ